MNKKEMDKKYKIKQLETISNKNNNYQIHESYGSFKVLNFQNYSEAFKEFEKIDFECNLWELPTNSGPNLIYEKQKLI
ncbi:hypothetical protein QQ008_13105 [Fulvivirgaceae bacterium BMA10]|uniref:Uncharacterized protein n=1 Tax=Splendidivirga corallicola TaxID=3051826 RepID=A0ABT8KNI1_9BACT|nr:hypothetical protein [Fulvivirgaceae bacterium BMA10]